MTSFTPLIRLLRLLTLSALWATVCPHLFAKPTLWLIGDSTVQVWTPGQNGWGTHLPQFFDKEKIEIVNKAKGGRSTRTFLSDGRWDEVLAELKPGDFVLMQFGHNDASPIAEDPPVTRSTRCRGTIRGNGDESMAVDNILTGEREVVYSYGAYLRRFSEQAKEHGATPVIVSPIPKRGFIEGKARRDKGGYAGWAQEAAESSDTLFLDLNEIVADRYDEIGEEASLALFADSVHTTPDGAEFNAECVVEGINNLNNCELKNYVKADDVADENRVPTLWIVGDSTVRNGHSSQVGWGEVIGHYFDPKKITLQNKAMGGRSSRTFRREGRWQSVLDELQRGDIVFIQFGHNDVGHIGESGKYRGSLKGDVDEVEEVKLWDGSAETVHSFGWYMQQYGHEAAGKGATVVFFSPVPHKDWNGATLREDFVDYRKWAKGAAEKTGAYYVDLTQIISDAYNQMGRERVESLFADARTHTSREGAELNAKGVIAGIKSLPAGPFNEYLSPQANAVALRQ